MKKLFLKLSVAPLAALAVAVLVGVLVTGCQTASDPSIKFTPVEGEEDLTGVPMAEDARLAAGDQVRITFSGTPDVIQPHEEQVKGDGTLTLPLIGPVKAEGKSAGDLQKEIHNKYVPDYYKRLTVIVTTDRRVYYVQGQVRASGRQEYIGPTTVLKAIASAGDFTDFANRKKVILTRSNGQRSIIDCIKAAKDSTYDVPVFPGDKIEVPMRGPSSELMFQFQILSGKQAGHLWEARRFPVRVGRAPDSDLCFEDDGVWPEHFALTAAAETGFTLSAHPGALVTVNQAPVSTALLKNGDVVTAGAVKLAFQLSATRQRSLRAREWFVWAVISGVSLGQVVLIAWLLG